MFFDGTSANLFFPALSSGAIVTITNPPVDTVTSTIEVTAPTGGSFTSVSSGTSSGSFYVYTSSSASSGASASASGEISGGGEVTLCFACGLTPVVTNPNDIPTGPPTSVPISSTPGGNYNPTCAARPGLTGTTTIFTTHTVTACGSKVTCPKSGYFIYTGSSSRPGQQVISTTNSLGSSIVFTQIPATVSPTQTGGGGSGGSTGTGGGGGGGVGGSTGTGGGGIGGGGPTVTIPGTAGPTVTVPGNADPTCPVNNGEIYTANMGMQYLLLCDTGFSGATLETQGQDRLTSCISSCDMYNTLKFYLGSSQCLGVNYYPKQTEDNCLLKAGSTSIRQIGTISGRLVTPQGGGGNGTGPGTGLGDYGSTIIASMSASPVFTEGPTRTETVTTTTTSLSISLVPTTILSVSTVYVSGSSVSEVTRTSISYIPAPTTTRLIPTTIYRTTTLVSTYISQGTPYATSIPYTTAIISYIPAPPQTQTVTTTTTQISYVPSTIYETRTTVSTFVSNGISYVTSYGISTAVSVSLVPVTTTLVSISVSERTVANTNQNTYGPPGSNTYGPPGPGGGTVTVTETPTGMNTYGPGGTVTITQGGRIVTTTVGGGSGGVTTTTTVYITRTVAPSSKSSSFTCRTYATNYFNGGVNGAAPTGSFKRAEIKRGGDGRKKRSIFDAEVVLGENAEEVNRPEEAPPLWWNGIEDGKGYLEG
jgi:hypothetical protein